MNRQSGISSLLAAAASLLVVGVLATGTPALAQSEEDLAAPQGSFVSTMVAPADIGADRAIAQPAVFYGASEEDAAVPPGSFTSVMAVPEIEGEVTRLAHKGPEGDLAKVNLSEIVAAGLE